MYDLLKANLTNFLLIPISKLQKPFWIHWFMTIYINTILRSPKVQRLVVGYESAAQNYNAVRVNYHDSLLSAIAKPLLLAIGLIDLDG